MTVASAMVRCLELEGVEVVFGIPGAAIAPFYDALYDSTIRHILVRHEQSAAHCASGYARVTKRVGVCVATSGPGALNLLTGVATAYMDSIPLVVITGQVASELLGRDVFQEVDITGAAEPFVKHSYLIKHANEVQVVLKNAFHLASTGRQGPVIIDIPIDIQKELVEPLYPECADIRSYNPNTRGHLGQIKRLIAAISGAKKPLICAGGGIFSSNAETLLVQFAERCQIPVVCTMMGLSAISPTHPLFLGMVGMYGTNQANCAVNAADLLILIGARVGDRAIMSPIGLSNSTTIAHLDIDPAEIGKNIKTHIPIVGDALDILTELCARAAKMERLVVKDSAPIVANADSLDYVVVKRLMECSPDDTVVVCDVGQNQLLATSCYSIRNGRLLASGGMGTMGYAIPAALGAALAREHVLCICGDGGFQMSLMELATIAEQAVPIKIVVINNNSLGLVKQLQQSSERYIGVDFTHNPNLVALARAYGITACQVTAKEQVNDTVEKLLAADTAYLLEVLI